MQVTKCFLSMSSRAASLYPLDCSQEMEAHIYLESCCRPAKDLSDVATCLLLAGLRMVRMDPSRKNSSVIISFAKPIPLAQVFDKEVIALDDNQKGDALL